jgi:Spy/CpxP family protein refolding chaperone
MKRLLVWTATIAMLTAVQARAAEEQKAAGGQAAPAAKGSAAPNLLGGKAPAQWYIESIEKIVPLSDDQKKAISQEFEARGKAIQDFQTQNKEKLQAAGKALVEAIKSQDKEKIAQAQKAYQDLNAPVRELWKKSQKALDDILTPEQRGKVEENRMAAWIKAVTDPVELTPEQMEKARAAYREFTKNGLESAQRGLPGAVDKILTPEQKTTIFKHRAMLYVKNVFARAKLTDEQMKKAEAIVDELAKETDAKTPWAAFGKLQEKIRALLTPEQKEAMKAPINWSTVPGTGGGFRLNPAPAKEKKEPAEEKKVPGEAAAK